MRNDTETSRVLDLVRRFVEGEKQRYPVSAAGAHVFSRAYFEKARRAMVYDIKEKGIRIA
jgi:hypothetical protein